MRLTVMESPPHPFFSIPFLLPYLQSCDGTVCPDHVGLCIIFTIYPTMTNPPINIPLAGDTTTRGQIIVRFAAASRDSGNLWPITSII